MDAAVSVILFMSMIPILVGGIYVSVDNTINSMALDINTKFALYCSSAIKHELKSLLYMDPTVQQITQAVKAGCPGSSPEFRAYKLSYKVAVTIKEYNYSDEAKNYILVNEYTIHDKQVKLENPDSVIVNEDVFTVFNRDNTKMYIVRVEVVVWR